MLFLVRASRSKPSTFSHPGNRLISSTNLPAVARGVAGSSGHACPVKAAAVDAGRAARVGVPRPRQRLPGVPAPRHPLPTGVLLVLLLRQRAGQAAPADQERLPPLVIDPGK